MNFSTAANVLRRSARPHESFMGASASAGHHLAAAEKEAGVGVGWGSRGGGSGAVKVMQRKRGKSQQKICFSEASDSGWKALEGLTSFRGIVCVISFKNYAPAVRQMR